MKRKQKLIQVFDDRAIAYDKYRPSYPQQVITDIIELSHLNIPDKVLEIGCGSGQISLPLAQKGLNLMAVEKSRNLAMLARKKLYAFPNSRIIHSSFEAWDTFEKFKLVISAQAFHWLNMKMGLTKILNLLEEGGSVALVWQVDRSPETPFWQDTSGVYQKYFQYESVIKPMSKTVLEHELYLNQSTSFISVEKRSYPWEKVYSKEDYLGLLSTFSNHMVLPKDKRENFFEEIAVIIDAHNGYVTKYYETVLLFAMI